MYVEKGTTCYVKAYNGNPRNASDPLTPDDKEEFAGKIHTYLQQVTFLHVSKSQLFFPIWSIVVLMY